MSRRKLPRLHPRDDEELLTLQLALYTRLQRCEESAAYFFSYSSDGREHMEAKLEEMRRCHEMYQRLLR